MKCWDTASKHLCRFTDWELLREWKTEGEPSLTWTPALGLGASYEHGCRVDAACRLTRNPERRACSEVTLETDRWSSCSINCRGEDVTHQSRHGRRGVWGREPGKASGAWVEEGLMELLCCAA